MKISLKGKLTSLALLMACSQVNAADWLALQGYQPEFVAPKGVKVPYRSKTPKVWGFIQANYKKDYGKVAIGQTGGATGKNLTPFSLLNPDLKAQEGFNLFRARVALRGMADNENLINYFFMTEFGNNGINNLAGDRTVATYFSDASVTLKHIPGAKIRVGMFKTPGSEEGLAAVFVAPYIEFTQMAFQQLLERQITDVGVAQTGAAAGGASSVHYTGKADKPIAAFRDVGAQVFDTLPIADTWDISYAYMYGNGAGISLNSGNTNATHYGYLSFEKTFDHKGRGYYTNALKFFVWGQTGTRRLLSNADNNTSTNVEEVNNERNRYGLGFSYHKSGLRVEAEYTIAEGMIYTGAKDQNADPLQEDWQFQFAAGKENKADGGYLNIQYEVVDKKVEIFGRYDYLNRLTNDVKGRRDFQTLTLGASYRFKGATRIDLNYLIREAKAPGNTTAQGVLDNMGNRLALQVTAAF
ncbi:hypothetical protein JHD46_04565 [Sulfurimonas sp. SAG-AH-194-C20]|nr:hypothetical protein [Sulfurimonas sp. SAG-AH-194-C20]MDF1878909.1 hypothetical protein [Sulfurimonas sp. SAG-AH-194-C20]